MAVDVVVFSTLVVLLVNVRCPACLSNVRSFRSLQLSCFSTASFVAVVDTLVTKTGVGSASRILTNVCASRA